MRLAEVQARNWRRQPTSAPPGKPRRRTCAKCCAGIVENKLVAAEAALDARADSADDPGEARRLKTDVRRLREKLALLANEDVPIKIDNQWYLGVHNHPATATLSVLLCIATGVAAGLINGALISALGVVPFIVTLGTMTAYLGLGKLVPEVPIRPEIAEIPGWVGRLTWPHPEPAWMLVASGVWLALVLSAALALLLRFTVLGRHIFAIGSNEAAARLCGINVRRVKLTVYALAGLFAGIAGIYNFSELSQGDPTSGTGFELQRDRGRGDRRREPQRRTRLGTRSANGSSLDGDNHLGLHAARPAQPDSGRDRRPDHRGGGHRRSTPPAAATRSMTQRSDRFPPAVGHKRLGQTQQTLAVDGRHRKETAKLAQREQTDFTHQLAGVVSVGDDIVTAQSKSAE